MKPLDALTIICSILSEADERSAEDIQREIEAGVEWKNVIKAAGDNFVTPSIYSMVAVKKLREIIPQDVFDYFKSIRDMNAARNSMLMEQTKEIIRLLNSINVEPLLMKGMANMFLGLYADNAMRVMRDIDILVRGDDITRSEDALRSAGYYSLEPPRAGVTNLPAMGNDEYAGVVELHMDVVPRQYQKILSTEDVWDNAVRMDIGNSIKAWAPSLIDRISHNIIHAQLMHGGFSNLYIQQMYDFTLLLEAHGPQIDWLRLRERFIRAGKGIACDAYLGVAGRLFGLPDEALSGCSRFSGSLAWAVFKIQTNHPSARWASFMIDNYIKLAYRIKQDPEARKEFAAKASSPGFYLRHVSNLRQSFHRRVFWRGEQKKEENGDRYA